LLLTGETGTGKDLVARVVHQSGPSAKGPFVFINCGALAPNLLEAELFGIKAHTASGVHGREGKFQRAHRGTLFLDEIGEMPLNQQVALLSVIEQRQVIPVGGTDPIPVDVRIIAATNKDLESLIAKGEFRGDLFFRLNVLTIELPPLRERKGDIPELARHFATQFATRDGRAVPELAADFLADLMQRDWPGNVRELENHVERVMTKTEHDVLHAESDASRRQRNPLPGHRKLADQVQALERRLLVEALRRCSGNQSRAARELGLTEPTLRNKLAKYAIHPRKNLRIS
jgi:transcriptional regulator with PAS, ATPase and Fis domain